VWANIDKMEVKTQTSPSINPELAMGLLDDLETPCGFWDEEVAFRGKADLVVVCGKIAYIVDWKTGNPQYANLELVVDDEWSKVSKLRLARKIQRVEKCIETDEFFAQPNGLCSRYCVVKTCPNNGSYLPPS